MKLKIQQIDAFSDKVFGGNPAAVCELVEWLPDSTLQAIASENNLSETAYYIRKGPGQYDLRWFTPGVEVDLCGHATLATAFAIFSSGKAEGELLRFGTRSGELRVRRSGQGLSMDFPLTRPRPIETPEGLFEALGVTSGAVLDADDYIVVVENEAIIDELTPDFNALNAFPKRGIAVTAPGATFDFVSRWFGPRVGVNEDPVTGSAHTWLAPYWAERLGKAVLRARQGGKRRGALTCEVSGDRVILTGNAVLYLTGEIEF
ncbi:UNVERIFIED_ORG: PhzF family phenazine biosynthesis protein (plasmid) [Roseateles sp. XES5]|nr:PhzF family phenazine biosynthesis protein [Roseateles sp. XES5]